MVRSHLPLVTWPLRRFLLICRRSCSRMSLKIDSPLLTFATTHGRYLRKMDNRGIGKRGFGTLSFVRATGHGGDWSSARFPVRPPEAHYEMEFLFEVTSLVSLYRDLHCYLHCNLNVKIYLEGHLRYFCRYS